MKCHNCNARMKVTYNGSNKHIREYLCKFCGNYEIWSNDNGKWNRIKQTRSSDPKWNGDVWTPYARENLRNVIRMSGDNRE